METLKEVVENLLKRSPSYQRKSKDVKLQLAWERAVGENAAKHCWPIQLLDEGILLVASESSVCLQQLKFLEIQILKNLEKELKEKLVTRLRFKLKTPPLET